MSVVTPAAKDSSMLSMLLCAAYRRRVRGAGRLLSWYASRTASPLVKARTDHGLTMFLDPRSRLQRAILRFGSYEPETLQRLRDVLRADDVYWDIGANVGCHVLAIDALVPGIRSFAFEASPLIFRQLVMNCLANRSRVTPVCIALGETRGYSVLHVRDLGESGVSSFSPWSDVDYSIRLQLLADTGDNIVEAGVCPPPSVIKIDVEGFEASVLAGMPRALASHTLRHVLFEGPTDMLEQAEPTPVAATLTAAGFAIECVSRTDRTYLASRN